MMTNAVATNFAAGWIAAWNSHDLDAILTHYTDEVEFTSPFVVRLLGTTDGTLRGKRHLRDYFGVCLNRVPDLTFSDCRTFAGATGVTLVYRSVLNLEAAETMLLDDNDRVYRAIALYRQP
jgi:hypothetical protein